MKVRSHGGEKSHPKRLLEPNAPAVKGYGLRKKALWTGAELSRESERAMSRPRARMGMCVIWSIFIKAICMPQQEESVI